MSYTIENKEDEIVIKGKIELSELQELVKLYKKKGYGEGVWGDENSIIRLKKTKARGKWDDHEGDD